MSRCNRFLYRVSLDTLNVNSSNRKNVSRVEQYSRHLTRLNESFLRVLPIALSDVDGAPSARSSTVGSISSKSSRLGTGSTTNFFPSNVYLTFMPGFKPSARRIFFGGYSSSFEPTMLSVSAVVIRNQQGCRIFNSYPTNSQMPEMCSRAKQAKMLPLEGLASLNLAAGANNLRGPRARTP